MPLHVLGILGSLRSESYNWPLLEAARELAPEGMEIETFELHAIPPFDAEVEAEGDPEPVAALKQAIRDADALVIASPRTTAACPAS